jgi:hypothetical protein
MIKLAITIYKSQIGEQWTHMVIQDSIMDMAKKMLDAEQ